MRLPQRAGPNADDSAGHRVLGRGSSRLTMPRSWRAHPLASGVSFLVDPLRVNRLWGEPDDPGPSARLLLRSMGYRDAHIGGLLVSAAVCGQTRAAGSWRPGVPTIPPRSALNNAAWRSAG
jgi:hypothetical protein